MYEEAFLYDLQADPYELDNLIGISSYDDVAAGLRERLIRRMAEAGEAAPRIIPAESKKPGQRRSSIEQLRKKLKA